MGKFLKFLAEAKTAKKGSKVKILSGDGKGKSGEVVVAAGDDHFIVQVDGMDDKVAKKHDEIEVITEAILTEAKTAKKGSKVKITSGDGKGKTGEVIVAAGDDHFIVEIEGMDEKVAKKHNEIEVITEAVGGVAVASAHFDDPINEGEIAKIQAIANTIQPAIGCKIEGWQYDWTGQRLGFMLVCDGDDNLENRFRIEDYINRIKAELMSKLDYKFIIQGGNLSSESWVNHYYGQYYIRKLTTTENAKPTIIESSK